jgi:hypothetical protein
MHNQKKITKSNQAFCFSFSTSPSMMYLWIAELFISSRFIFFPHDANFGGWRQNLHIGKFSSFSKIENRSIRCQYGNVYLQMRTLVWTPELINYLDQQSHSFVTWKIFTCKFEGKPFHIIIKLAKYDQVECHEWR